MSKLPIFCFFVHAKKTEHSLQVSCSPFLQNLVCCVIFMGETYCNATLVLELDDNKYRRYPKQQTNLNAVITIIIKTISLIQNVRPLK